MPRKDPEDLIVCPEGYSIDLYCDQLCCFNTGQALGPNRREARKDARDRGWRLNSDGTATCPYCLRMIQRKDQ